jgi:hypothetical protein
VDLGGVDGLEAKLDAPVGGRGPDAVAALELAVEAEVVGDEAHRVAIRLLADEHKVSRDDEICR